MIENLSLGTGTAALSVERDGDAMNKVEELEVFEPAELKLDGLTLEEQEFEEPDLVGKNWAASSAVGDEPAELEELEEEDAPRGLRLVENPYPFVAYGMPENNVIADRKMNSFVPNEFIRLLGKRSIMDLKLGDHLKREMTIFFSDIRQFTEIFESISPEEGFRFINSYFTRVVPIINQYGGFVDKYIGDSIMAIFPQSNGADMAIRASVEIQKQIREYNKHRANAGYRALNVGIGIHTGPIILGVVGTHNRMQNTVISDAVNLASRIEGLTKTFGVAMAISGQTFRRLEHPEKYMFRYLGNVRVKGKSAPTSVYEILNGIDEDLMEKKVRTTRHFEQGLFSFALRKYSDALDDFNTVLNVIPEDRASVVYSERCHEHLKGA